MGHLRRATWTYHKISAQTSHEGIEFTKAKEKLSSYFPNLYTVHLNASTSDTFVAFVFVELMPTSFFWLKARENGAERQ